MTNARTGPNRAAYLLLETLVALTIVSVGFTGVIWAFRASLAAASHSTRMTIASHLAEQKLAEIRVLPSMSIGLRQGDFGPDFQGYTWKAEISPVEKEAFYSALVEVFWQETGQQRSITLASLVVVEPVR
jgi:hypothetical protein